MERRVITPRPDWEPQVEALGFDFYRTDGIPYWDESVCWRFTAAEIDRLEAAANALHQMALAAAGRVVRERLYPQLGIPPECWPLIEESWRRQEAALYGRFDLLFDGKGPPKLLEYNADTPTSLFEAAVVQWNWKEQVQPKADQFNSLHEALIARWQTLRPTGAETALLHLTCATPNAEDETTTLYLGSTAEEAAWRVKFLPIAEIGWDQERRRFVDLDNQEIVTLFKLYPWEWLLREEFGWNIAASAVRFIEPAWKLLLANKGLLALLWEMYPGHENLLPAYLKPGPLAGGKFVRKPMLGREGANIRLTEGSRTLLETEGGYGAEGYVYQAFGESLVVDGNYLTLGTWMIGDECHGMGLREDQTPIISNRSRFVPHYFE
jgi:glutathionylspermidine synthase